MVDIQFVSAAATPNTTRSAGETFVVNAPTGLAKGDLILLSTTHGGTTWSSTVPTMGPEWTQHHSSGTTGNAAAVTTWSKRATDSEPSTYSVTANGQNSYRAVAAAYRNVGSFTVEEKSPQHNGDNTTNHDVAVVPSVTAAGAAVVTFNGCRVTDLPYVVTGNSRATAGGSGQGDSNVSDWLNQSLTAGVNFVAGITHNGNHSFSGYGQTASFILLPLPLVRIFDSFNRADTPSIVGSTTEVGGKSWSAALYASRPAMSIASNRAVASGSNASNFVDAGTENGTVYGTVGDSNNWPALYIRESGVGCYRLEFNATTVYLEKEATQLASASLSTISVSGGFVPGMKIGLSANPEGASGVNTRLVVTINGTTLISFLDTSATQRHGTRAGQGGGNTSGGWDAFEFLSTERAPNVPPFYLGSTKVSKLILGTSEITTAYLGGTKL